MTQDERNSIIEQLSLITGYNTTVFEKLDDTQLEKELAEHYA